MNWYYALGEKRQGPISDADLEALLAAGTINEETLVWKEGMAHWTPLKEARAATSGQPPAGWIRCTATGRYFPPEEIVYLDEKPYSAAAKPEVLQNILQTGAIPGSEAGRTGPPWENRGTLGFFKAAGQTIWQVLCKPSEAFATMKREGGVGSPLLFNVLLGSAAQLVTIGYNLLFHPYIDAFMKQFFPQTVDLQSNFNQIIMVVIALLTPVILTLGTFLVSGILHVSLLICSGAQQPFETTYRTNCFAYGATVPLHLLPLLGPYLAVLWWVVLMCIGLSRTHEISGGRSVVAVLLPVVACCVSCLLFYGVLFAFLFSVTQAGHH
jgi:hypothetical protein